MELVCVLLLHLVLSVRVAGARPSSAATEQAKKEVLTALSVGNPGHAEEILDRAFRADPDPTLLYQLGLVAQAQGRPVAALDLYRRYQEIVGSEVSAEVTRSIESFAQSLVAPFTVLNVSSAPGGLLCVDDKIVGTLPLRTPLLIAGGTHRFRIEQRNEQYESGKLAIPDGREADLRLTPGTKGTLVALLSLSPITLFSIAPKGLSQAARQALGKALEAAVRKNHLAPLPDNRLAFLLAKQPADCMEQADCQYAVAEQAQARSVLRVLVKEPATGRSEDVVPTSSCSVELAYFDVNAGAVAASGATESRACAGPPLLGALSALIGKILLEAGTRPRAMISISSIPEGADVRVDGLLRGQTPYLKASFTGPHEIVIEREDTHPFPTRVEVKLGQVTTVEAALKERPKAEKKPAPSVLGITRVVWTERQQPRPRWRLAVGGVAIGAGVLLTGFGISAVAINGQCARGPQEGGLCDGSYSTGSIGGGLLGAGLALAAGGAALLAVPGRKERVGVPTLVVPETAKATPSQK